MCCLLMCYVHLFLIPILGLLTSQKRPKTQRALISFQISSVGSPDFRKKLRQIIFPEIVYSFLYGTHHIYEVPKHIKCVVQAGKFSQVVNKGTCPGKVGARCQLLFRLYRRLGACTDTFGASPSQVLNDLVPARKKNISRKAASSRFRPKSTHIWHTCLPGTAESSLQVARLTKTKGVVYILHKSILLNPLHISVGNGVTPFLMPSINSSCLLEMCKESAALWSLATAQPEVQHPWSQREKAKHQEEAHIWSHLDGGEKTVFQFLLPKLFMDFIR